MMVKKLKDNYLSNVQQVKIGAILSYVLIAVNTFQGFFLSPYILAQIGESNYGVYKTIGSLTTTLMVLDLGIGTTVMRYTAKFRAEKKMDEIGNFLAMGIIEAAIISILIGIVCICIYAYIPSFYLEAFSKEEIILAQRLFLILTINMILLIIENVLNGVITGCNHFVFSKGIKIICLFLRILAIIMLLRVWNSAIFLVTLTLVFTVATFLLQIFYVRKKLKIDIRLRSWNPVLFKESLSYTVVMFIQTIAVQVNGNVDNIIVSNIMGASAVAVYSFGIVLFNMYEHLSTAISGVMLPTVTNILNKENGLKKVQDLIIQTGRVQFILLGAAVVGFSIVGKDFIYLWLGDGFQDVYIIALILMIPSLFELCVNVCLAVLRAKHMLKFRTVVLLGTTIMNIFITIVGVRQWGYLAAAVGTAISYIVGNLIIMNIYYCVKLKFNMLKIYRKIVSRIWVCLLVAGTVLYFSSRYIKSNWFGFLMNVIIFMVVYLIMLLRFGLDMHECMRIPLLNRIFKNRTND